MAYVIVVCDDNTLRNANKERIMQRSKLVDSLYILAPQFYKEQDMSEYTVMLEYVLPCSKKYCTEILELSEEKYEDHLKYMLPFDTQLTSEAGDIEIQLTFAKADLDNLGRNIQRVRKTSTTKITIVPISAWSDIIPDSALSAIDQRLIKVDAQIKAIDAVNATLNDTKADNIVYEDSKLQLVANGKKIGNVINISTCNGACSEEGIPVVDFSKNNGSTSDNPDDVYDNVINF